jgi:hypothetical protein
MDVTLVNVHDPARCKGRPCVIHNPSNHHMRSWPLNWRGDTGVMERICPHGVGHPDPDDAAYNMSIGRDYMTVHGCDGCCSPPEEVTTKKGKKRYGKIRKTRRKDGRG